MNSPTSAIENGSTVPVSAPVKKSRRPLLQSPTPNMTHEEEVSSFLNSVGLSPTSDSRHDTHEDVLTNSIEETSDAREAEEDKDDDESSVARREEEESIALARALMAEEAMAVSYHMSVDYLRNNRDEFSEEDLAALQAAMDDDEPQQQGIGAVDEEELAQGGEALSYEMMLRLGDQLGDVKSERWAMVAREKIECLPVFEFDPVSVVDKDENDCCVKCLVCQFVYEEKESLRELPCGHRFHADCIDQWLSNKNFCPYCRQSIVDEE